MTNNYAHTILVTITLLLFQTVLFGQDKEKPSVRKPLQYDKWITIESNANIKNASNNKPGGISTNFVLIGRLYINLLKENNVQISMDGKGRAIE